jgi:hypothetical protein
MDNCYFTWRDAKKDSATALAKKFKERFPEITELGWGRDWEYAGWYVEMLGFAERGIFPVAYGDYYGASDRYLETTNPKVHLPMPPGGEAVLGGGAGENRNLGDIVD